MTTRSDEFRRQVNELWKNAVDQLEEVKDVIVRSTGRFEADLQRLRHERDRLLKRLGEQTYKLANQGKLPMPAFVKSTVERLNDVVQSLVARQNGKKRTTTKKTTRKKAAAKRAPRTDVN